MAPSMKVTGIGSGDRSIEGAEKRARSEERRRMGGGGFFSCTLELRRLEMRFTLLVEIALRST